MSTTIYEWRDCVSNSVNQEIRSEAKRAGVRLWEIAERLGMNDGNFSRKLRRELNPEERRKILAIINDLETERMGAC